MQTPSLQLLFPYPVVYVPPSVKDVDEYVKMCYEVKQKNPHNAKKIIKGRWEGGYDFFNDASFNPLTNHILEKTRLALKTLNLIGKEFTFINAWINVSPPGSYNGKHIHPGSTFSGVFYLQVPKNSGNIIFSASPYRVEEINALGQEEKNKYKLWNDWEYEPEVDSLILFPSTLCHEVSQNKSQRDRISVVFTLSLR